MTAPTPKGDTVLWNGTVAEPAPATAAERKELALTLRQYARWNWHRSGYFPFFMWVEATVLRMADIIEHGDEWVR